MEEATGLQVVEVNDEIIDLRNHEFDDPQPYRKPLVSRSSNSKKILNAEEQRQTVVGLKKLANTLYNGPSTPLLQKHRNIIRNRQKGRGFSIDPRFRKDRSPAGENLCKSDSNVGTASRVESIKVSHSSYSLQQDACCPSFKDRGGDVKPYDDSKGRSKKKDLKPRRKTDVFRIEPHFDNLRESDENCECKHFKKKFDSKMVVEQATMTEENLENNEMDTQVIQTHYESAISSILCNDIENIADQAMNVSSDIKISNDISPYWNDPRLVEKYANVLKPINIKPARSSWTLPFSNKKNLEANEDSSLVFGYSSNVLNTYKYDNNTDVEDGSMTFEIAKNKLWEALWKNYNFTPFFILGSLCGLGLVGLMGWMLASDFLWVYFHPVKKEEKWYDWFHFIAGGLLHAIESILRSVSYILLVPRNEILNRNVEQG